MKKRVNLSFLNVSRPGEFSRVEPQAPLLEVALRQSLHVSGLRPRFPRTQNFDFSRQSIGDGHGKCGELSDRRDVQPETHPD